MELWIRSQNKDGLAKIHSISIEEKTSTKFSIVGNSEWILSIYETEERALEVLDEIQSIIIGKYMCDINLEGAFSKIENEEDIAKLLKQMAVYEMPEE